ncbi:DOMON-like domain-containing protein [Sphingomonas cannabina]|uniref:DOMON-like domain-containing protein n=1 Tax=Sphingomonas cannabina TaxID=2899123 RepID=UPI001F2E16B9|nr:DOMON-like domain-containing protein [Sphingomonas cannabina]UIJ43533.1 DOMON-like domain-containing protein [Sphingomonas cannabina]
MKLIPHPASPPDRVDTVQVEADIRRGISALAYRVVGGSIRVPSAAEPVRTDGLWRFTCFELFVKPEDGEEYFELNFSPSTQWAAYRFDGYRDGMRDQPLAAPTIEPIEDGIRVTVDLGGLPAGDWRVALTAVVEEQNGTKSYWALAHPPEKPDFHDDACFALELSAADEP